RRRAMHWTLGTVAALLLIRFALPAPHHVTTQGIVWLPEDAHVRAGSDGVVTSIHAAEGALVKPGQMLGEAAHPILQADARRLRGRLRELQAEADAELRGDRVKPEVTTLELREVQTEFALQSQRLGDLRVPARATGTFVLAAAPAGDLPGRYLKKGEL